MKLSFRQGIISAPANFLAVNTDPTFIDLVINSDANNSGKVLLTFSQGKINYLLNEDVSKNKAWGPFPNGSVVHLYWEIDSLTGQVSRKFTTKTPVTASSQPAPEVDLIWFDTTTATTYVYNGVRWDTRLILFAGKYTVGSSLVPKPIGSQVGITEDCQGGFILTDNFGKTFRNSQGELLTSETDVLSKEKGSLVRLEGAELPVVAAENISAFTLVYIENGKAHIASSDPSNGGSKDPIGVILKNVTTNNICQVMTSKKVVNNDLWNFSTANVGLTVYCDNNGQLTFNKPNSLSYTRVGVVVDNKSVLFTFDRTVDFSISGSGGPGPKGPPGDQGPKGPPGDSAGGMSGLLVIETPEEFAALPNPGSEQQHYLAAVEISDPLYPYNPPVIGKGCVFRWVNGETNFYPRDQSVGSIMRSYHLAGSVNSWSAYKSELVPENKTFSTVLLFEAGYTDSQYGMNDASESGTALMSDIIADGISANFPQITTSNSIRYSHASNFQFGTDDFTIEIKLMFNLGQAAFGCIFSMPNGVNLQISNSGTIEVKFAPPNSGMFQASAGHLINSGPFKLTIVRKSGVVRVYFNNDKLGSDTNLPQNLTPVDLTFGGDNSAYSCSPVAFNLLAFRIVKGKALYFTDTIPSGSRLTKINSGMLPQGGAFLDSIIAENPTIKPENLYYWPVTVLDPANSFENYAFWNEDHWDFLPNNDPLATMGYSNGSGENLKSVQVISSTADLPNIEGMTLTQRNDLYGRIWVVPPDGISTAFRYGLTHNRISGYGNKLIWWSGSYFHEYGDSFIDFYSVPNFDSNNTPSTFRYRGQVNNITELNSIKSTLVAGDFVITPTELYRTDLSGDSVFVQIDPYQNGPYVLFAVGSPSKYTEIICFQTDQV